MLNNRSFLLFLIICSLAGSPLYADVYSVVERAIGIYPREPEEAVALLDRHYTQYPRDWMRIKSLLERKEQYSLYRDFLGVLTPDQKIATELLRLDLLVGEYGAARDHTLLLLNWADPPAVGLLLGAFPQREEVLSAFLTAFTNQRFRTAVMWSYLKSGAVGAYDRLLLERTGGLMYTPWEVTDYLLKSWLILSRDVGPLILKYRLGEEKKLEPLILVSYYLNRQYTQILRVPEPQIQKLYTDREIDYFYLRSRAYFYTGDYERSISDLQKVYYPWRYDLESLWVQNLMGLKDWAAVRKKLKRLKSPDDREYFSLLINVIQNNTNQLETALARYHGNTSFPRYYQTSVMLLSYTWYRDPASLNRVGELLLADLLRSPQSQSDFKGLPSVYQHRHQGVVAADSDRKVLYSLALYQQALDSKAGQDSQKARQLLIKIIEDEESSSLMRSLAVYQLRQLDQEG